MKKSARYKIVNKKRFALCDYEGRCKNIAYMEVYPFLLKGMVNSGWNYLCKRHYYQELRRFKGKLPAARA